MTDAVTVAIIVAVPPTIVGVGGLIIGMRNRKEIKDTRAEVKEVHITFNSRQDKADAVLQNLADVRVDAAYAKGKEDQRQAEK